MIHYFQLLFAVVKLRRVVTGRSHLHPPDHSHHLAPPSWLIMVPTYYINLELIVVMVIR